MSARPGSFTDGLYTCTFTCRSALDYITTEFSSKNAQLRALTTQGNRLPSLSFRAEVTGKVDFM